MNYKAGKQASGHSANYCQSETQNSDSSDNAIVGPVLQDMNCSEQCNNECDSASLADETLQNGVEHTAIDEFLDKWRGECGQKSDRVARQGRTIDDEIQRRRLITAEQTRDDRR